MAKVKVKDVEEKEEVKEEKPSGLKSKFMFGIEKKPIGK